MYYCAVRSAARLQAQPVQEGGWAPLFIAWEEDRATLIDGRLYQLHLLPFTSKASGDFLIKHDGTSYTLPFGNCATLGLRVPRYRFNRTPHGSRQSAEPVRTLHLELAQATFLIDAETQEEYGFGEVYSTDLNLDGALDAVLHYDERFGSGREAFGALLLNCGDDSFVAAGRVSFGRAGVMALAPLQSQQLAICGVHFTTLVVQQPKIFDPANCGSATGSIMIFTSTDQL